MFFALPERFDMTYTDKDSKKKRPMVIHRSSIGCYERTLAMLIEEYAGKFPVWLSPVQARVLPITDKHIDYAKKVVEQMKDSGIRAELDDRKESTNKKVREAQLDFIPYILVVGNKEAENKTVNVRTRDNVVHGEKKVTDFVKEVLVEIKDKK